MIGLILYYLCIQHIDIELSNEFNIETCKVT